MVLFRKSLANVHELNHQEVESALQIKALVIELLVYILRSLAVDQENKIETRLSKTEKEKKFSQSYDLLSGNPP